MIVRTSAIYVDGVIKLSSLIDINGKFDVHEIDSIYDECKACVNYTAFQETKVKIQAIDGYVPVNFYMQNNKVYDIKTHDFGIRKEIIPILEKFVVDRYGLDIEVYKSNMSSRNREYVRARRAVSTTMWAVGFGTKECAKAVNKKAHGTMLHHVIEAGYDIGANYEGERNVYKDIEKEFDIEIVHKILNYKSNRKII